MVSFHDAKWSVLVALVACGGSVDKLPTGMPTDPSVTTPTPSADSAVTGDATPESLGFVKVTCIAGSTAVTDLSEAAKELGFDELGYYIGFKPRGGTGDKNRWDVLAQGSVACTSDACTTALQHAVDTAITAASAQNSDPAVWAQGHMEGPSVFVVLAGKNGVYQTVSKTADLRALIGPVDTAWKAHLFVLATAAIAPNYYAGCAPYDGYAGPSLSTYVRAATPNEVLGVSPAPGCSKDAETSRVLLTVDTTGTAAVSSGKSLWKGDTGCE